MAGYSSDHTIAPVIKGASYFLAHVPGMIRHGSKPSREIVKEKSLLSSVLGHLRSFDEALAYPPNQAFIGNIEPESLWTAPAPWYKNPVPNASRWGDFGEIMPEEEFLGMMKVCDEFDILLLDENFLKEVASQFEKHPLLTAEDIERLGKGFSLEHIKSRLNDEHSIPLYVQRDRLVGCAQRLHDEDTALVADVLIENLAARASGVMGLRHLIKNVGTAEDIDYLLGCGEEAVGDRYNRGGGNLSKAIGELCGCNHATGSDVKAFCCAPVHAIMLAAGLVSSGVFENVVLVAGGSFAKLGMKFQGHLRHDMPILEDVLAGISVWISRDDGTSPVIRLDSIGKQEIGSGSAQQAILQKLVVEPADRLGLKLTDIDRYATEMHNPEVTEPQGSGNVPRTNYRTIGSFAVMRSEIERAELDRFVETYGMPGFSPTQGHIASAIPYLGHAVRNITSGKIKTAMFLAKGSLFLGRMTQLADGISFLLDKNDGGKK